MAREFVVGTVDDTPLLMITVDGMKYLVDLGKKVVFFDKPGIPQVKNEALTSIVIKAIETKR